MDVRALDEELLRLRAATERIGANLLALEEDPTAALLTVADLTGATAVRWSAAQKATAALFQSYAALRALVDRATAFRGERRTLVPARAAELAELLYGRSVEVADRAAVVAARELLSGSRVVERETADETLARMAASFDEVRAVLGDAAEVWDEQPPRVQAARRELVAITHTAAELDVPVPVAGVEEALDALGRQILSDPLSADLAELDELERRLAAAASQLADIAAVRANWAARLDAATQLASDVAVAIDRCAGAASVAGQKIRDAPPAPSFEVERGLAEELERIAAMADTTDWTGVAGALAAWHDSARRALERADRAAADQQALLATRDELRGRLRALEAKAERRGRLEDPTLRALHSDAHATLYTAPTDLARAAELVGRYQHALSSTVVP